MYLWYYHDIHTHDTTVHSRIGWPYIVLTMVPRCAHPSSSTRSHSRMVTPWAGLRYRKWTNSYGTGTISKDGPWKTANDPFTSKVYAVGVWLQLHRLNMIEAYACIKSWISIHIVFLSVIVFCPRKLFKHNAAPYSGFLQLQAWITEHRWKLIAGRNLQMKTKLNDMSTFVLQ